MRFGVLFACFALLFAVSFAAQFSPEPYLYKGEDKSSITYVSFSSSNNGTAKIVKINGEEAFLLLNEQPLTGKAEITSLLQEYYNANYYPSQSDMAALRDYALAFNKSRNYISRYGPVEQVCLSGQGTGLDMRPCNDLASCMNTASLICSLYGAEGGCLVDVLGAYTLDYKKGIDKLNDAQAKFFTSYNTISPSTVTVSLAGMSDSFDAMTAAANGLMKSKLIFPETTYCADCLGRCPEPHFDYGSLKSGKEKAAELAEKVKPYAAFDAVVGRIYLSTQSRMTYKDNEEKALIFAPRYNAARDKFSALKAQAVEGKSLVADSQFVVAADSFLNKGDELEIKFEKREFEGFDAYLAGYEASGRALAAMINNSTSSYKTAFEASDDAGDSVLQAQWRVNRLSHDSVSAYNTLADRKNKLDAQFKPPMTSTQYVALAENYRKLATDSGAYSASQASLSDSVFGVGNTLSRASVDGTLVLAANFMPISFKTRQSFAKYVPPLFMAAIDLSILAVGLLAFVAVFYYFHGFFKNKLLVSGWVLTLLGFVFILLIGSVGFYSIVLSAEKYSSFSDFYAEVQSFDSVAIISEDSGISNAGVSAMHSCADQVASQLAAMGKKTYKYYISGTSCTQYIPKNGTSNATAYETKTLGASACLDSVPNIPIVDLQYANENAVPTFTTVVTKQAIFRGNEDYYSKKPICDAANVLG